MGAHRKKLSYIPDPDYMVDCITLGHMLVENLGGGATHMSKVIRRAPKASANEHKELKRVLKTPDSWSMPKDRKWCSCCGENVNIKNFSPRKGSYDGLDYWCKTCRADYQRKRNAAKREEALIHGDSRKFANSNRTPVNTA